MGESSLTSFCPLFGFLRRAPSSGEAELETTWTSRGLGKVTLATFSLPSQHLPYTCWPLPQTSPFFLSPRPPPRVTPQV